jgi:transcriptional regulator with XRE-family HTH domain
MMVERSDGESVKRASAVDQHVGAMVRMRRKALGLSQDKLADALGLTFQQVQKYERGTNRISASKLFQIAETLQAPVSYFFRDLDGTAEQEGFSGTVSEASVHAFLMSQEGLDLARLFPRLKPALRRRVLDLVRTMAEGEQEAGEA